ncbi:MAG: hypothetical protein MJ072_01280 [Clostridia bacterium]|nr:hypothetical protein [Clostridia bacterium]
MDNFGLYKLISGLKKTKPDFFADSDEQKSQGTDGILSALSGLGALLKNTTPTEKTANNEKTEDAKNPFGKGRGNPLITASLNHDEFVKRVIDKNKKKDG